MSKLKTLLITTACLFTAGCSLSRNAMTTMVPPLEAVKTLASYDIIGTATGESYGSYLLGFIPLESEDKEGAIASDFASRFYSPVQKAAVFNAIASQPDADALIAPRWEIETNNYLIYRNEKVKVTGKAIRFNISTSASEHLK